MYDQGSVFIGNDLSKSIIEEEYGIKYKPISLVNPNSDAIF